MKTFKKVISLVLVFAMLASFAGMTGFTPSIIAEAKHILTASGAEITMWSTIYKINYVYTMTYPKAGDYSTTLTSDEGDYAIPQVDGFNELAYDIICPAGTTKFGAYCSLDGQTWRGWTVNSTDNPSYFSSGKAVMNRSGATAMKDEYGVLYRDFLQGKGVEGFRDIGKIYWKVVYTCNGTEYTEYWTVDVLDWDRQNNVKAVQWTVPATTDKPSDSQAGKNQLKAWKVPATLYKDANGKIIENLNGVTLDTEIKINVPTGTKSIAYYLSENPENGWTCFYSGICDPTVPEPFNYTGSGCYNDNVGYGVSLTMTSNYLYYKLEYTMDVEQADGTVREVTYTQFAFSWVTTLPYFRTAYGVQVGTKNNRTASARMLEAFTTMYQQVDFINMLSNGFNVSLLNYGPYDSSGSDSTDPGINSYGNSLTTAYWDLANHGGWPDFNSSYTMARHFNSWYQFDTSSDTYKVGDVYAYFLPGYGLNGSYSEGTASQSEVALGAKLYYDGTALPSASSINVPLFTRLIENNIDGSNQRYSSFPVSYKYGWGYEFTKYTVGAAPSWTTDDDITTTKDLKTNISGEASLSGTWVPNLGSWMTSGDAYKAQTTSDNINFTSTAYNGTAKNYLLVLRSETHEYRGSHKGGYLHEIYFSYAFEFVPADRTIAHNIINAAIANNYVEEEMDPTWWSSYMSAVCDAYRRIGDLTVEADSAQSLLNKLNNPVYVFADYSELSTELLTVDTYNSWDRGSLTSGDGMLTWGADYATWNANTHNNGGKAGEYATYNLAYDSSTNELYIDTNNIRSGEYYYTTSSWSNYVAARNRAAKAFNYPVNTNAFDYNTSYANKTASDQNKTVGLACYCKAEIDAAVLALNAARKALVKKDTSNGYDIVENAYKYLVSQTSGLIYDGDAVLNAETKHGLRGVYDTESGTHYYDVPSLLFRANTPADVFDYVYPNTYDNNGMVICDDDGNPLYCLDDNETKNDITDDTTCLASDINPATGEAYDTGILVYPDEEGIRRPVGKGNTFTQLLFDNSAASGYAVTNARTAISNRLKWYAGGRAAGYEWLGMVQGAYTENVDGTGVNKVKLTEEMLADSPSTYMWTGIEHQDDILRAAYAIKRVAVTVRLATNYREVVAALNSTNGKMPDYDIEGTKYNEKGLYDVTLFHSYYSEATPYWDKEAVLTANNRTYNTSGKTWYTADTWNGFIADRNALAKLIYNGSTGTTGAESEINADYSYASGIGNKYYTYDAKLGNGTVYTNTYFTNGYYYNSQGGTANLAIEGQDAVNELVDNYLAWFDGNPDNTELVLKDLDVYTWEAYTMTGVSTIKTQVNSMLSEIVQTQPYYDFISTTDSANKTASATLNESETISLYDPKATAELQALADAVMATAASTEHPNTPYQGSDSLADKGDAFNTALANFKTKYDAIKTAGVYSNNKEWQEILDHLTVLAEGTTITLGNLESTFTSLYTDTDGTIATDIKAAISAYEAAGNDQAKINAAVKVLYDTLSGSATSVAVGTAADVAIAYPNSYTFNVYNYTMSAQAGSHETPSRFTTDSVTTLTNTATTAKNKTYPMLETYVSTINADKAAVEKLTGLASAGNGGVLVYTGAVTTYLEQAIAYAEEQLYSDVANKVVKTTTVTNPAGTETVEVSLYSEQSVAELEATLAEAREALAKAESGEYGWDDQIELDKYTFLVYDETAPDTGDNAAAYLLAKGIVNAAAYDLPYKWSTVAEDGTVTKEDLWESAANGYYEEGLYGNRLKAQTGMANAGLQSGPAYYGFLDAEYKATTVVKTNDDGTTTTTDYLDIVWDGEGNLILTSNNVAVGATTFNNWSSYIEYYDQVAKLSKDLTIDDQSTIDTLAGNIYRTRNALTLNYFPSNQDGFAEATKLFNQLKAYETATTPITRYGYAADENGDVVYGENGALMTGDDPTSSAKQHVAIYSDIPAGFIAAVAEFEAAYASTSSTKPYDSLEEAQGEYAKIYNAYLNPETAGANLITAKSANHEDFYAGMNDLVENYIAGAWNGTTYSTTLLNSTQAAELQTRLTNAEAVFTNASTVVDSTLGVSIAAQTDIVFTYTTTNNAYDLLFATYMRDNELYPFLDYSCTGNVPYYYDDDNDGSGEYTYKLFDETVVNQIKASVDSYFVVSGDTINLDNATKWPLIYQVNGLTWNKKAVNEKGGEAAVDGYEYTDSAYTGTYDSICNILNAVASHSTNYTRAVQIGVNSFNTTPYFWLIENTIKTDENSNEYILGDVSAVRTDNTAAPFNYDVSFESGYWYSAGCGADESGKYYLYNDSSDTAIFPSWFIDNNAKKTFEANINGECISDIPIEDTSLSKLKNLNPVAVYNEIEGTDAIEELAENGWTVDWFSNLTDVYVEEVQSLIDGFANDTYDAITALQLRPATEAYRDVYLTYLGVKGSTATFGNSYSDYVGTETTDGVDVYTFYNLNENTFLNQFTGYELNENAVPPYGTVSKSNVTLWENYKDEGKEQLEAFIAELIKGTVTVDKAELVNGYNPGDGVETDMEKLIVILSTLELKDRDTSWLDALVEAFLTDNLSSLTSDTTITLFSQFPDGALTIESSNGGFYKSEFYTEESLIALAQAMQAANAIQNVVTYNTTTGKYEFSIGGLGVTDISPYKGSMYTNATQDQLNEYVKNTLLPAIRNDLVLAPASTTSIDTVLEGGATAAYNNPNLYVANDAWDAFVVAYKAAVAAKDNCVVNVDGSYYTKLNDQETVNQFATKLADALKDIVNKADSAAPKMTVSINDSAVSDFYTSSVKVDNNDENSQTNADRIAEVDSTGAEKPVTGTFFMPDNGGYSLLVYTNEVSPRIVLEIEDVEDANGIEATKHEVLSVKSSRSSGTTTELIYGTKNGRGAITEIFSRNLKTSEDGPLEKYENTTKASAGSTKNEEGSSLFAVLAPTFVANSNGIAVAIYSISVNDAAASGENVAFGTEDNYTSSLVIGEKDVDVTTSKDNEVTVYIYYHNSMNDVTDEGITVAEDGTVALAAPSKGADHVASVLFSNEIGYAGAWKNSIRLHRQFSSNIRSWEFMSEITDNKVGNVENVTYNDPNFGDKNLGSFYYVLDKTTDADIYATYAESNDATGGVMDYDRATVAKEAMKTKISEMTAEAITAFKKSDNFHVYGAVDENDNYVNYIQHLTDITENGDLVFVHVVDRWGNVVNRIIEITRVDKTAPVLTPDSSAHTLTIVEEGGSGLTGIQISNSSYSEGGVDLSNYSISESVGQNVTKRENGSMQVECAGTTLQISGLTAGRSYYFAVTDKAGNLSGANVTADASGNITIKIGTNIVIPESDEEIVTNAITLNGTDTIILNAGEASSVIDASLEGNVFANRTIRHFVTTYDNVTQLKTVYQDGTVEEWTSDNAYLTDNGDGTLTWVIPRKLAEGEHSYKVYAMVDGEYETFYAPATITATSRTVTLTYMVAGMGRMILKYSGSAEVKNSSYKSTVIPYGAKVTITAENNTEGCDFYYWINNYTNRIISVAETYEFTAVTNINCSAQFTSCESYYEAKKLVVYVNNAKNVVEAFELAEGETYTVPAGPVLPDYTFKGWSMTKEEVLASDKDTVIVEPVYTLSAVNTVTITEGNYTATGAGTYTAEDNQRAVVTISTSATDDDGNEFLYWLDDDTDEIVSYDRTYSFFCVKDTVLTPVYGDASTVTAAPIVRITEVRYSALSGKVSFFAERSIPEEFTLLQTGIVVTKTESIGTNDEVFIVGGTSTAAGTSTSTANNGYYSASTAISTGQTVWARAYAIYETADGEILEAYGPVTSYTVE